MNQDNYLAEALKMRNLVSEFNPPVYNDLTAAAGGWAGASLCGWGFERGLLFAWNRAVDGLIFKGRCRPSSDAAPKTYPAFSAPSLPLPCSRQRGGSSPPRQRPRAASGGRDAGGWPAACACGHTISGAPLVRIGTAVKASFGRMPGLDSQVAVLSPGQHNYLLASMF